MATFKERMETLWEKAKDGDYRLTQEEFAARFGATRNQLKGWLAGAGEPKTEMIVNIAKTCGVSTDYLLGLTDIPDEQLLFEFNPKANMARDIVLDRDPNFTNKALGLNIAQEEEESLEDAQPYASIALIDLPIYGSVKAGEGGYALQEHLGTKTYDARNGNCHDCYMLIVKGDSMTPRFLPGDYAIVRPQNDVDSGDIAIVIVDDEEGTIKRIKKFPGGIVLQPDNRGTHDDREFWGPETERIKIIGKVIDMKPGKL